MTARPAAAARHWLWRLVLTLTGGLTVVGALPRGGCVVVANHSSHADTAALLAAVRSRHAPRVAAAADYWFAGGWRAAVCRALAAAFPVRRTGGGSADMEAAVDLLRAGRAVIVYPEGTRGTGVPARFHAGAFRLAAAAGVPVVPVGIAGTADLLPKHGRLHRARVTVRIGTPVPPDPEVARAEVARLAGPSRRTGRSSEETRRRVGRVALSGTGLVIVAAWSFAEAIVWPLLPELVLFALVPAAPRAGVRLVPAAVLASMAGGLCTLALGMAGAAPAAPLVTERMRVMVAEQTADEGAQAVRHQPLSGIPFKVYAAEAGRAGVDPLPFLGAAIGHRGVRIASVGAACTLLGVALRRWPERYLQVLGTGCGLFAIGLTLVVAAWM
ncbi:1-acyl-sn-glycerol-3-phosphate acyltransferase [Pseudonocardia sp. DSM 110487]|uniref:lysophospholipid acyltransferase family protein n=1 Tax=Pseudonocardia sp. DSM 110487 TaxID=2865833 RepID=UPI001C694DEF|nr:lysophospholipid acyltransferase family protein [Pseudonocardia sp. DSM 110487]QYN34547.1 1-acyl-sn-glycerol-3-phosphate acyltransferase [Pseudonocardia sp. DSM 110487]